MYPRGRHQVLFLVWIAVIVLVVLPWGSWQDHAHWSRVDLVPFVGQSVRLRDIALNAVLYLPFGYWHAKVDRAGRWWRTAAFAFALSCGTELAQVFSHSRFPSITDVTTNVAGAAWGSAWARRGRSRH